MTSKLIPGAAIALFALRALATFALLALIVAFLFAHAGSIGGGGDIRRIGLAFAVLAALFAAFVLGLISIAYAGACVRLIRGRPRWRPIAMRALAAGVVFELFLLDRGASPVVTGGLAFDILLFSLLWILERDSARAEPVIAE